MWCFISVLKRRYNSKAMKTTERWLEHPQFVNNSLPWSLCFYICLLLMYKKLCPLRDSSSVVDAEGDQDNLFIPCSGRVFSIPSVCPWFTTTHAHKYMFRMPKRKFWHCLRVTVKQFISKLRGKFSKTAKRITFFSKNIQNIGASAPTQWYQISLAG